MKIPSGRKNPFIREWVRFNSQEMLLGIFIKPILFCAACFFLVACTPTDNISTMTPVPTVTVSSTARATSLPATPKSPNVTITPLTLHLFPTRTPLPTRIVEHPTLIPISKGAEECLPPLVVADYPGYGEGYPTPQPILQAFPPGWNKISTLSEKFQGKYDTRLILARPQNGYDEFWISVSTNPDNAENSNYFIYRTDTKDWAQAPQPPSGNLFLDDDYEVWAKAVSKDRVTSILYRLDETTNLFTPLKDNANLLSDGEITSNIKIDGGGRFWFIFKDLWEKQALYSFDPITLEAKPRLSGDFDKYIEMDEANGVYIQQHVSNQQYATQRWGWELMRYNPNNGLTKSVNIPFTSDSLGDISSMYLDHEDRLWLSDLVWYRAGSYGLGVPNIVVRSPIFIDYLGFLGYYSWLRPKILLQSIDGRLWYQSSRGDAWFDHATGEWCLFTPHKSNIVEDSQHNLWMLIGNDLYTLTLIP